MFMLSLLAAAAVAASGAPAGRLCPRVAVPSAGLASDDVIVYTADAREFGADPTGKADSTAAIQAALEACDKESGGTVFLPAGRYRVSGTIRVSGGTTLRGEWAAPGKGAAAKGTVLMVYTGRGETAADKDPAFEVRSAGCIRNMTFWYPEQRAENPVPYSATILGRDHSVVENVTLVNSWTGFWNNSCSSMLIRGFYATCLSLGIHGAYAYDIPRIEDVSMDPRHWAESGLPGAPSGAALSRLEDFCSRNLTCIQAGEQDWGYWWNIDLNRCRRGIYMTAIPDDRGKKVFPANVAVGKLRIRNAETGLELENISYPGFQLTYADVSARKYPLHYTAKPDLSKYEAMGIRPNYFGTACVFVSGATFRGGEVGVMCEKNEGHYNLNLADCTFEGYSKSGIRTVCGHLTVSSCRFRGGCDAIDIGEGCRQAVLVGNEFPSGARVVGPAAGDLRIFRDDADGRVPPIPKYDFVTRPHRRPSSGRLYSVADFGAARGTAKEPPKADSTEAFRAALAAAGKTGGTVYVPAGAYALSGSLVVPSGVELRGSYEGAHYGNGSSNGTMIWVTGGKGDAKGEPFVTMGRASGVRGFTFFYPEQGYTDLDKPGIAKAVTYPPTLRAAADCWIRDCAIVGTWNAIDAMTARCDRLEVVDVTGAALRGTLLLGHGARGGTVHNLHFNYSGWTQQGRFPNIPYGEKEKALCDFTTRRTRGLVLGDARDFAFHSCFNIIVSEQVVLQPDPFTGGSFRGKMWGIAFDAARLGVVGREGSDAAIGLIAAMGVYNQQGGGYMVETEPGFRGRIAFYNTDAWDARSRLVNLRGGSVSLVQLFSWCCYEGVVGKGADLRVLGSAIVADHANDDGSRVAFAYEAGSKGVFAGNLGCKKPLNFAVDPSADVAIGTNGFLYEKKQK